MCDTMNLYYKYISIQKSSFYNINILIPPISILGKSIENTPYISLIIVTTSHYESNLPYSEIRKFHDLM